MNFEFDEEQERLRDSLRRYLADRAPIRPYLRSAYGAARGKDDAWNGLADLGVVGLIGPTTHGGSGGSMVDAAVALEECGRALYPGPLLASAIGAISIATANGEAGSPGDGTLADLCAGTLVGAVALFETGAPTDWRTVATTVADHDGELRASGGKTHVLNAADADVLYLTAREPDGSIGLFVADSHTLGFELTTIELVDGSRPCSHVHLQGVPVRPVVGDAAVIVEDALDRMRTALVVDAVGAAQRALELTVDYAKQRIAFGKPIGSFQAIQHLSADMLRAVELARAAAYYSCWAIDAAPRAEARRAATMAAAFASDELVRLGNTAIQVFGGIGFTWEHDIHLFYKRLLSASAILGTADDHLMTLADLVFDAAGDQRGRD